MRKSTLMWWVLAIGICVGVTQAAFADGKKTWEQKHTFAGLERKGPFGKDPHIWVYTAEFAKRFGMPEKWIDPDLKGIEAAAWKKVPLAYEVCGWGGKEDACGRDETCDMEVYVDKTKNPLPWSTKRTVDVDLQFRSAGFLAPQGDEIYRPFSEYTTGTMRNPFADSATGEEAAYFEHVGSWSTPIGLNGYDMEVFSGLSLLVFRYYRCGYSEGNKRPQVVRFQLETRQATPGRAKSAGLPQKQFHEFVLPESFDFRIRERLKVDYEAKRDFYRRSLDQK